MFPIEDTLVLMQKNKSSPANYWIYAMVFSTMIPTALHALIGSVGLSAGLLSKSSWIKAKVEDRLTREGDPKKDLLFAIGIPALVALIATGLIAFISAIGYLLFFVLSDTAELFVDALFYVAMATAKLVPG